MTTNSATETERPIPNRVSVERAKTPHHHRFVRHQDEPRSDERQLEVVLFERGEPDYPDERIAVTNAAGGSHFPYSEQWGEVLTPDQALRLARMLEAAAHTMLNERGN